MGGKGLDVVTKHEREIRSSGKDRSAGLCQNLGTILIKGRDMGVGKHGK